MCIGYFQSPECVLPISSHLSVYWLFPATWVCIGYFQSPECVLAISSHLSVYWLFPVTCPYIYLYICIFPSVGTNSSIASLEFAVGPVCVCVCVCRSMTQHLMWLFEATTFTLPGSAVCGWCAAGIRSVCSRCSASEQMGVRHVRSLWNYMMLNYSLLHAYQRSNSILS